ncbi:Hemolysins related proteins containing CBS domains [Klebsiella quasipneumoniae]|nr:Hemolysins related proteins containing CBS domains [Klebsiella quasipneumoniae]
MMPLVWLLNTITRILMRMMGIRTDTVISSALSKDELRTIVNESRSQISRRNQDMLLSVLDLEKVSVNDIMVPRNEIVGIDINDDWKSIVRQLTHSPHGRIVLYPRFAGRCHQHAARPRSLPTDDGEERVHKRDHAAGGR